MPGQLRFRKTYVENRAFDSGTLLANLCNSVVALRSEILPRGFLVPPLVVSTNFRNIRARIIIQAVTSCLGLAKTLTPPHCSNDGISPVNYRNFECNTRGSETVEKNYSKLEQFFSIISIELKGSITRCRYYTREGMPERKL